MDTAKLWLTLLCICGSWILSLATNCDWTTEYEFKGRCCKACPSGEYPKVPCQEKNSSSVCEKCLLTPTSNMDRCFCKDNHLCFDDKCESCKSKEKCKPGHQLMRYGRFDYSYMCKPCPNNTCNDAENSTSKPITKCDGVGKIFPGNHTHNARCLPSGVVTHRPTPGTSTENGIQYNHSFMVACLIVTVLTFLVFFMYTAFQMFKYKMLIKLRKPCTHALPSDTCSCKLSKEEMGEESDSKTEVSEENRKFDVNSFP